MELHEYQKKIVERCKTGQSLIMSVGMGLGKTAATLHYIEWLKPLSMVIVAPKRVAETVWKQEAEKWGLSISDKFTIVSGTPKQRVGHIENAAKPYKIIGRDNLQNLQDYECDLLVIDELTTFKNVTAKRSIYLQSIKARQRIGLTGTFLVNGAVDIFGQAVAVGLEHCDIKKHKWRGSYSPDFESWRSRYFVDVLKNADVNFSKWVLSVTLEEVLKPYKDNIYTLDSADYLDIPEVTYHLHPTDLTDAERLRYNECEAMMQVDFGGVSYSVDEGAKFAKLQQLCNGFIYCKPEVGMSTTIRSERSGKLEAVADFCERAAAESEAVLLFYAFKGEALWLAELLKERGLTFCSTSDKQFLKKWNAHDVDVLMAHPASAGHGLNLQGGGRLCVWSSITYNYEYWAQANARLARQGQNKAVQIHVFSTVGTCEENQYKTVTAKADADRQFVELTKNKKETDRAQKKPAEGITSNNGVYRTISGKVVELPTAVPKRAETRRNAPKTADNIYPDCRHCKNLTETREKGADGMDIEGRCRYRKNGDYTFVIHSPYKCDKYKK